MKKNIFRLIMILVSVIPYLLPLKLKSNPCQWVQLQTGGGDEVWTGQLHHCMSNTASFFGFYSITSTKCYYDSADGTRKEFGYDKVNQC